MPPSRPIEVRFWEKVSKATNDKCWLWMAAKDPHGYGYFWNGKKMLPAPRVSWQLNIGPIPDGKHILHRCDNPTCVNPNHLFLGTQAVNNRDCADKGRMRRSQEHILKLNQGRRSKPDSEETRKKMRQAKLGRKLSAIHKERIAESGRGRSQSEETRRKIREAMRRIWALRQL